MSLPDSAPSAIREVLGLDLGSVTDVLTDFFRGFPEWLQQNSGVLPEIALHPLPSSRFPTNKDANRRCIASLHEHKSANNILVNVNVKVSSAFDLVLRREDVPLWGNGGIVPPAFNSLCTRVGGPQSRAGRCSRGALLSSLEVVTPIRQFLEHDDLFTVRDL
jgi:hypothetical protein